MFFTHPAPGSYLYSRATQRAAVLSHPMRRGRRDERVAYLQARTANRFVGLVELPVLYSSGADRSQSERKLRQAQDFPAGKPGVGGIVKWMNQRRVSTKGTTNRSTTQPWWTKCGTTTARTVVARAHAQNPSGESSFNQIFLRTSQVYAQILSEPLQCR